MGGSPVELGGSRRVGRVQRAEPAAHAQRGGSAPALAPPPSRWRWRPASRLPEAEPGGAGRLAGRGVRLRRAEGVGSGLPEAAAAAWSPAGLSVAGATMHGTATGGCELSAAARPWMAAR